MKRLTGADQLADRCKEIQVRSLDQEEPLEKEMATHSSFLTWEIPRTREAWRATVHEVAKESDVS